MKRIFDERTGGAPLWNRKRITRLLERDDEEEVSGLQWQKAGRASRVEKRGTAAGIYNPVSVQYSGSRAPHKRVKLITHGLARGHNDSLYGFEGRLADLSCDRDIPRIPY